MKAVGSSGMTVEIVCQENHGQGANFRSYHWWKCFRVWNLSGWKNSRMTWKTNGLFLVPLIGGTVGDIQSPNRQYIPPIYSKTGGLYATYHLLGGTRNNPLIFHRLCYGSSPQWRSQLRWVFFKFASSGWSFQQMDFCLLSTYFFLSTLRIHTLP